MRFRGIIIAVVLRVVLVLVELTQSGYARKLDAERKLDYKD